MLQEYRGQIVMTVGVECKYDHTVQFSSLLGSCSGSELTVVRKFYLLFHLECSLFYTHSCT